MTATFSKNTYSPNCRYLPVLGAMNCGGYAVWCNWWHEKNLIKWK